MPTRQIIQTGTTANDGTGDTLRDAGGKINQNFRSLFQLFGDSVNASSSISFDSAGRVEFDDGAYSTYVGSNTSSSNKYINFPNNSGTVVLEGSVATLSNKTLISPKLSVLTDSAGTDVLTFNGNTNGTHNLEVLNGDSVDGVSLCVKGTDSVDIDLCLIPGVNGSIKTFGHVVPENEQLSSSGAASVHKPVTFLNSGSTISVTLADGTVAGEEKKFVSLNTGTVNLTPVNFEHSTGNTTVRITTHSACTLIWSGTHWHILSVSDSGITVV
jgi:hypothetical protein